MITATQLLEEHRNDFGGRPQRIQRRRDAIRKYVGLDVPRSVAAVEEWYSAHKSTITRKLNEHIDEGDDGDGGDDDSDDRAGAADGGDD